MGPDCVDTESGPLDDESSPLVACSGPLVPTAIDLWVLAESVTDNSFVRADSSVTTRCNRPERPGKVPSIVKQPYWSSTTKRMAVDPLPLRSMKAALSSWQSHWRLSGFRWWQQACSDGGDGGLKLPRAGRARSLPASTLFASFEACRHQLAILGTCR
jgi:hypothetical protein